MSYLVSVLRYVTNVFFDNKEQRDLKSDPKTLNVHTTSSDIDKYTITTYVPVTSLIPAVWITEPPVSGTTQVYSPVGDV